MAHLKVRPFRDNQLFQGPFPAAAALYETRGLGCQPLLLFRFLRSLAGMFPRDVLTHRGGVDWEVTSEPGSVRTE